MATTPTVSTPLTLGNTVATPTAATSPQDVQNALGQGFRPSDYWNQTGSNTIDASQIGNAPSIPTVTPSQPSGAYNALGASVSPPAANTDQSEAERTQLMNMLGSTEANDNPGAYELGAEQTTGLNSALTAKNSIDNQIQTVATNYDTKLQNMRDNPPEGVGGADWQREIQNVEQQKTDDLAVLSIQQSAATNNYTQLNDTVTKMVSAYTDGQNSQIKSYQDMINNIDADPAEKEAMQEKAATFQANVDAVKTAGTSTLQNAAQNGAPASVLAAIGAALKDPNATPASIYQAAGKYASDPKTAMDIESAASTIAKNYADIANEQIDPSVLSAVKSGLNTYNGVPYYTSATLDGVNATTKNALTKSLITSGAVSVSPDDAKTLDSIKTATDDTNGLASTLLSLLPVSASGQPSQYLNMTWNKFLQTNPNLATFAAQMNTDVLPLVGALKGVSGGGGGSSRIFPTISAMLPQPTDTVAAAQAKLVALQRALQNGANNVLNIPNTTQSGKPFDYGAAIKAGYSPDQIQAFIKDN